MPYTDHPSELIQTNMESLQNKQVFTEFSILTGAKIVIVY